jgi:MarR family transcriptional regulator, 2-MHQ and catechol-resistance regulon repressor
MTAVTTTRVSKGTDLQRDAAQLQAAVSELVRVYQFRDRDRICCHDISVTQCYALEMLVEHGPMRLGGLVERLFLDKSTTSRVVSSLVKKGYVEQRPDADDGRATALHVTASGRRLYRRITDDLVEQQKQLLEDLDPEVREGVLK